MDIARERSTRLRELIARPEGVATLGARDAWAARLLQKREFECIYLGGFGAAASRGQLDRKLYPSDYMIELGRIVAKAVEVPVMVDMDEVGAGPLDIRQSVHDLLETTRVGGGHGEDQPVGQKRCGQHGGKMLLDFGMSVARMKCAIDAVRETRPEFVFMARTDAFSAADHKHDERAGGDIDEAIRRAVAYADVGADVVWCEFPRTDLFYAFEQFAEGVHRVHPGLPLGFNISPSNLWNIKSVNREQLNQMGYKFLFCTYGLLIAETFGPGAWEFAEDFKNNCTFALVRLQERLRAIPLLARYEPHNVVNKLLGIDEATALEMTYDPTAAERFATSEGHR